MAYEKHTWSCGETVTADLLNHMEDGIAEGGGSSNGFFPFEIVYEGGTDTASKTFSEITSAIESGLIPIAYCYSVNDGNKRLEDVMHITRGYEYGGRSGEYHFANVYVYPNSDAAETDTLFIVENGYVITENNEVNGYEYTAVANAR